MPHSRDNQDPPRPDLRGLQPDAASAAEDRRFDRWLSRRLHEAYDNEQIDFDTFEERRAELMSRLKID